MDNDIYSKLKNKEEKLAVVGLGYVGMPLAVAFAEKFQVTGFDTNSDKIAQYKDGRDLPHEVGDEKLSKSQVFFTDDEKNIQDAVFIIVAVPTPINGDKTPDLTPVIEASRTVGRNLKKGAIVVYESTVYPGVTCPDIRNTKVMDVINKLREYDIEPKVTDPQADPQMVKNAYGIDLVPLNEVKNADCIIHAVSHKEFAELGTEGLLSLFRQETDTDSRTADRQKTDPAEKSSHGRVLIDVKGQWPVQELESAGVTVWRL